MRRVKTSTQPWMQPTRPSCHGERRKDERARILNAIADVIEENAEHLALVESIDNGKPIRETRAIDVAYSAEHFRYFAGVLLPKPARPIWWRRT